MSSPSVPALLTLHRDNIPILMGITILEAPLFLRALCNLMAQNDQVSETYSFPPKCQADKHLKFQHSCSADFLAAIITLRNQNWSRIFGTHFLSDLMVWLSIYGEVQFRGKWKKNCLFHYCHCEFLYFNEGFSMCLTFLGYDDWHLLVYLLKEDLF